MTACLITMLERQAAARAERKASLRTAALNLLANEFINAMRAPDARKVLVSTPGFNKPQTPLVDLVSDMFSGKTGDEALAELLGIVSAAAKGESVQMRAMRWIASRAGEHAEFHADDLAEVEV